MIDVDALIAKQKAALDKVEPVTQDVLLGDEVVGVRFWPLSGVAWRDLTARHPWREDAQFDQSLGYNLDGVLRDYPRVYLVQGDTVTDVADKWAEIVDVLTGADLKNLGFAIWGLNEFDPQNRLATAGKASKGAQRKKRSSPASSASQSENSTGGPQPA